MSDTPSTAPSETVPSYPGQCRCGDVQFMVRGEPRFQVICHCESCQKSIAGPFCAVAAFPNDHFHITSGSEHITSYNKYGNTSRCFCKICGTPLWSAFGDMHSVCIWNVPSFPYTPQAHVQYAHKKWPVRDGLPKWSGYPHAPGSEIIED